MGTGQIIGLSLLAVAVVAGMVALRAEVSGHDRAIRQLLVLVDHLAGDIAGTNRVLRAIGTAGHRRPEWEITYPGEPATTTIEKGEQPMTTRNDLIAFLRFLGKREWGIARWVTTDDGSVRAEAPKTREVERAIEEFLETQKRPGGEPDRPAAVLGA